MESSTNQSPLDLTLEQQFYLQAMMRDAQKMSENQRLEMIEMLIQQSMMKDNYLKSLGRNVILG